MPNEDQRDTPADGFRLTGQKAHTLEEILETVHEVLNESRDIKIFSQRACESAIAAVAKIPELETTIAKVNQRIDRIVLFQAWFPTLLISAAILARIAILARVLWLR